MRSEDTDRSWLAAVALPLLFAALNFFAWPLVTLVGLPAGAATLAFNAGRLALMAWAGSRVASRGSGGWAQALAGISIMVVDHVLLKGGGFLIEHWRGKSTPQLSYLMAFGGVLVSFVMFIPLAAFVGWLGGRMGRRSASPRAQEGAALS